MSGEGLSLSEAERWSIGVVGAGFIMRDCHLPAYKNAGIFPRAITSRRPEQARAVADRYAIEQVNSSVEAMLDAHRLDVVDIAVPPPAQTAIIRRILQHPRRPRGILAQKPLAMSLDEARDVVLACRKAKVALQVNQNMRYDQSVRGLKRLLDDGLMGDPVLATIEMRAIPHWMPWAEGGRSLATYIMSIHHLDTFRYWLGEPARVMASTRKDPRTKFDHFDGINLYILEFDSGARASAWDDVWAGPAREGAGSDIGIRWRFEGTRGLARGTIGWPGWPERVPSTLDYTTVDDGGAWHRPRWPEAWFPDAFAGPMIGLLNALEKGEEPDISGRDNLRTIALCEAVLRSAKEHRVTVPRVGSVAAQPDSESEDDEHEHEHEHEHDS